MSLHIEPNPEARKKLDAQKRNSIIASVIVSLLSIILIGLVLALMLLPSIVKESVTIVTYTAAGVEDAPIEQKKVSTLRPTPSAPSSSASRVIVANTASPIALDVPDTFDFADFGSGSGDFGDGWSGDGDGHGPGGGGGAPGGGLFGSSEGPGLAGTFYDLKQDPAENPTDMAIQDFERKGGRLDFGAAVNVNYDKHLERAVRRNLAENSLSDFFRAPKQLRLTQLYIPRIGAEAAPKAFEIGDKVKGRRWVISYRGTVVPPETGRFRFVGFCDDVLVVLVNNRVVLDGSLQSPLRDADQRKYMHQTHTVDSWQTYIGKWLSVTAGKELDLKILIGERPGGHYSGYLLIEKAGLDYQMDSNGSPVLPLFKMAPSESPKRGATLPDLAPDTSWSLWPGKS